MGIMFAMDPGPAKRAEYNRLQDLSPVAPARVSRADLSVFGPERRYVAPRAQRQELTGTEYLRAPAPTFNQPPDPPRGTRGALHSGEAPGFVVRPPPFEGRAPGPNLELRLPLGEPRALEVLSAAEWAQLSAEGRAANQYRAP